MKMVVNKHSLMASQASKHTERLFNLYNSQFQIQ
jgi:hypothetical protein